MSDKTVIIDSGIGGLSVINHLLTINPDACITYCADNRYFPYGIKKDEELIIIIKRLLDYFLSNNYKIIIACNTASRIFNNYLKAQYPNNVYSIIESTIADLAKNKTAKRFLIIGTSNTIRSKVYETEIKKIYNVEIISKACSKLVEYCENNDQQSIKKYIEKNFKKYQENIDTLILGCTHFNILGNQFDEFFNNNVNIIYSGYALMDLLKTNFNGVREIYLTKKDVRYQDKINTLFTNFRNYEIKVLNI